MAEVLIRGGGGIRNAPTQTKGPARIAGKMHYRPAEEREALGETRLRVCDLLPPNCEDTVSVVRIKPCGQLWQLLHSNARGRLSPFEVPEEFLGVPGMRIRTKALLNLVGSTRDCLREKAALGPGLERVWQLSELSRECLEGQLHLLPRFLLFPF